MVRVYLIWTGLDCIDYLQERVARNDGTLQLRLSKHPKKQYHYVLDSRRPVHPSDLYLKKVRLIPKVWEKTSSLCPDFFGATHASAEQRREINEAFHHRMLGTTYDGGSAMHGSIRQIIDHIELKIVAHICAD